VATALGVQYDHSDVSRRAPMPKFQSLDELIWKSSMSKRRKLTPDEIGYWSEIKLDIIREYAQAYSTILTAQKRPRLHHVYIDAFAGAGFHVAKGSGDLVWGSPAVALLTDPPFKEYHFIDLDRGNVESLREMIHSRTTGPYDPNAVHLYNADCNDVLIETVFPRVQFEQYRRGLCLLDPYGLHLDWRVIEEAGRMRSVEIFLNFPILDMNRNVLHHDYAKVPATQIGRMNRFWGDESWRNIAYKPVITLFGAEDEKTKNATIVAAFRERLKKVAGFSHVPEPIPMRNSRGAVLYYLFFAFPKPVAQNIVMDIFKKYRNLGAS
jgi:three-Cys-motif partner protein